MAMNFFNNSITTTASEANLFDVTANAHYATYLFTNNMQNGDTVVVKWYVKDVEGATMRLFESVTLENAQTLPSFFISFLQATQYKVTIQRLAGTDRAFNWLRVEVS